MSFEGILKHIKALAIRKDMAKTRKKILQSVIKPDGIFRKLQIVWVPRRSKLGGSRRN